MKVVTGGRLTTWSPWVSVTMATRCSVALCSISAYQLRWEKKRPRWNLVCANTTRWSCDFSGAPLLYLGKYKVRVRAQAQGVYGEEAQLSFHPLTEGEGGAGSSQTQISLDYRLPLPLSPGGPPQQGAAVLDRK